MPSLLLPELTTISNVVALLGELSPSSRARALAWINDYFSSDGRVGEALRALPDQCVSVPADGIQEAPVVQAEHAGTKAGGQGAPEAGGQAAGAGAPKRVCEPSTSRDGGAVEYEEDAFEDDAETDEPQAEFEDEQFESFLQLYELVGPRTARQKVATAAWWLEECEGRESWKSSDVSNMLDDIERPLRYISTTIAHERQREDPLVERMSGSDGSMSGQGKFHLSQFGRAFVEGRVYE